MKNKNELTTKQTNHCVVNDDTHGWGGVEPTYEIVQPKVPLRNLVTQKLVSSFPLPAGSIDITLPL